MKSMLRLSFEYEGKTIRPFVGLPTQIVHLSSCYSARILMQAIFITGTARQQGALPIIPEVQKLLDEGIVISRVLPAQG
jgi:hypothetical protein